MKFKTLIARIRSQRGIRTTLIIYFTLFALVPMGIVVTSALNAVTISARQQAMEQRELALQIRYSDLLRLLENAESSLELTLIDQAQRQRVLSLVEDDSTLLASARPVTIRNVTRFLEQQLAGQENFSKIAIYNVDGVIVASTIEADVNNSITAYEFYEASTQTTQTFVHSPEMDLRTNTNSVFITTPIVNDADTIVGVVVGELNLSGIHELLGDQLGSNQTGEIYLVMPQSNRLLSPPLPNVEVGESLTSSGILSAVRGEDGVTSYKNYHDIAVIGAYRWLPELNLALIAEIEEREALAVSSQIRSESLGISLLSIIGVLVVSAISATQITHPIGILTDTATAVMNGDLSQRAYVSSRNEIGKLAHAFNRMTDQQNSLINTLEQRVSERTKELEEAREVAEAASQAKSVFLSNMSHELRTPLNMIIGYTSSMLNMPKMYEGHTLPTIYSDDIQLILQNGQHLLGLINDILDLSKIEAGKFSLHITTVDLIEVFRGIIATSVGLVRSESVHIRPDYPANLPHVRADQTRVRQILLNLMSNAIKFTEVGIITLHAHQENDEIVIWVKDTGIGIPEAALETIFDRFQQVQNNISIQGTGLGLDITQRLAQMHGSHITIESDVGKGSQFSFNLPIAQPEELLTDDEPEEKLEDLRVFDNQTDAAPLMVLYVETNSAMRQSVHEVLEDDRYVLVDMDDIQDIGNFAAELQPDVIIFSGDYIDKSVWQAFEQSDLLAISPEISIVVLTDAPSQKPAHHHERIIHLPKSFVPSSLLEAINDLVNKVQI